MKKRFSFLALSLFLSVLAMSLASAHDIYYDHHSHFDTRPISYSSPYYVKTYVIKEYRPIFIGPYPRTYGHGYQDVYFKIDNYKRDHKYNYRNDCDRNRHPYYYR